ncbi:hypothetical protein SAMN05216600_108212 [Pseudomonas cuatrocienegasensis]|uniref:Uncharacterized protein n=1 Tax=Pseudomonas cuatrocienegasensis TaxID=543360 RepID=A0ABY1BEV3_9PSED|nr:hypothetical protein SAMN05216600_108212 [Pseudomonas cuatrocienegasensis]
MTQSMLGNLVVVAYPPRMGPQLTQHQRHTWTDKAAEMLPQPIDKVRGYSSPQIQYEASATYLRISTDNSKPAIKAKTLMLLITVSHPA